VVNVSQLEHSILERRHRQNQALEAATCAAGGHPRRRQPVLVFAYELLATRPEEVTPVLLEFLGVVSHVVGVSLVSQVFKRYTPQSSYNATIANLDAVKLTLQRIKAEEFLRGPMLAGVPDHQRQILRLGP
jgi:hypothetical protein